MVKIVCGKGRVRKKFQRKESQSLDTGLTRGKQEVCVMEVVLLHL